MSAAFIKIKGELKDHNAAINQEDGADEDATERIMKIEQELDDLKDHLDR